MAYTLNLIDLALTLHALRHGAMELNPLMRCVSVMVFYKIVVVGVFCWWLRKQGGRLARWGLTAATIAYGAVNLWHIINLIGGI